MARTDTWSKRIKKDIDDDRKAKADTDNRDANTDANVEQGIADATFRTHEIAPFTTPCRVTFHHTRGRLADLDGLSGKAVIDGIVSAGIFADDSPKQIEEIRNRQTKGRIESTRIVIEEI